MAERLSSVWLQLLRPPPLSIRLRLPAAPESAPLGTTTATAAVTTTSSGPERLLHFQLTSQISPMHSQRLSPPAVCYCHGLPAIHPPGTWACSVTKEALQGPQTRPDPQTTRVGQNHSVKLPSSFALPGPPAVGAGGAGGEPAVELVVEGVVLASSLSESLTYGWPHLLVPGLGPSPAEDEGEDEGRATEERVPSNKRAISALCTVRR
jgi:hypothetical protein